MYTAPYQNIGDCKGWLTPISTVLISSQRVVILVSSFLALQLGVTVLCIKDIDMT